METLALATSGNENANMTRYQHVGTLRFEITTDHGTVSHFVDWHPDVEPEAVRVSLADEAKWTADDVDVLAETMLKVRAALDLRSVRGRFAEFLRLGFQLVPGE
jgi:hypothetical protein